MRAAARERLSEVTRGSLWAGIAALASARRVGEIGDAVQGYIERAAASDGGEYGLGAEMGISTDKLHARGPMGLVELTCQKFIVLGDGHIRE